MRSLIDVSMVAERLGLPRWAVYDLARSGTLPVVKLGRRVRFDESMIEQFIERGGAASSRNSSA